MRARQKRDRRVAWAAASAVWAAMGSQASQVGQAAPPPPGPHVVMDGTLGKAGLLTPTLGNYSITPDLGQQKGGNLFQSFTRLDLTFGESATFSGPASVQNVIARVTGGVQSSIDGMLRCTIPDANFYLVNPSGVVFGPNSKLDVKGSFAVTTAGVIKLADGGQVNAVNPSASVLTTAAPAAFGFLTPGAPSISVTGIGNKQPVLAVPAGNVVSLVGGPITLNSSQLAAPGGRVNVVAVASAGDVAFDATNLASAITLPAGGTAANISMTFATISADGTGGGRVSIRGNNVMLQNSTITAQTLGAANGSGIDINAAGQFSLVGSSLTTADATPITGNGGSGSTGSISITAGSILIDSTTTPAAIVTDAMTGVGAKPGAIQITASSLQVLDSASSPTNSVSAQGDVPGTVSVNIPAITLNGAPASLQAVANPGQFQFVPLTLGSVTIDGSLGTPAMSLSGPVFQVESSMGRLIGDNLFQSFGVLNVAAGETVEFDGPAGVSNVIARVTGNSPSTINGTISCTINGANLFLINPAGIVFGSSAALNVQGAFAATTADFIGFSDGGQFNARNSANTQLTDASPVSFGFSSAAPGTISVSGSLAVPQGATLALAGGQVQLNGAQLSAPGGRINIVGASSAGIVPIALGLDDPLTLPAGLAGAAVTINSSTVDVTGDGGRISIRGSDVLIQNSAVSAPTDVAAGQGVDIVASGQFSLLLGSITAGTNGPTGSGQGGSVAITAASIVIDGRNNTAGNSVGIITDSTGSGGAGNITLQAGSVQVFDGTTFSATGPTNGHFTINSPTITFDGSPATLVANSDGTFQFGATQDVVLDGSLGQGGALTGPNYDIDPSLGIGKVAGPNLFESFSQLSLASNENLTINGPSSVQNVLVRVTGSSPATIDGTFTVAIPGANLFLIDAAGVSITSNAQLLLGGALVMTSANSVLFASGGRFDAVPSAAPLPTSASISGFEFTTATPGAISLNVTNPITGTTNAATSVSLVGGPLTVGLPLAVQSTGLSASYGFGQINLIAVAAPGQVLFNPTAAQSTPDVSTIAQFSNIQLAGTAADTAPGGGTLSTGGPLFIRGNNLTVNYATGSFASVDIALTGALSLTNASRISAINGPLQISQAAGLYLSGDSSIYATGNVNISAGAITLDSRAGSDGTISGNTNITVNARTLTAADSVFAQILSYDADFSVGLVQVTVNGKSLGPAGSLILDGTLNPAGASPVSGIDYVLSPAQGSLLGTNLFLSLSQFDLPAGERLAVTAPSTVQNILIRVTGGPAEVDGVVNSNSYANVFFIDPAGITFGSGASVSLGGSFVASTANYIQLGSAGRFDAANPQASILTADAPAALGFGASPAGIIVQKASLSASSVSLVCGSLQIANSQLYDYDLSQQDSFAAVAPNAVVAMSLANPVVSLAPPAPTAASGNVSLSNVYSGDLSIVGCNVTLSGMSCGDLTVTGQNLTLNGGTFGSINTSLIGNVQSTGTTSSGNALSITATNVSLQNFTASPSSATFDVGGGLSITGSTIGLSHLSVSAGSMTLDSSTVTMATQTAGMQNDIQIQSGNLSVQNNASISTNTSNAAPGTAGGDIRLNISGTLAVTGGSSIMTVGGVSGGVTAAGSIFITAGDVFLDSGSIATVSGNSGLGGSIMLSAVHSLTLYNGGQILAANQDGTAGQILINTAQLSIDTSAPDFNLITSQTSGAANAAPINITAGSVSAANLPGFQIFSSSSGTGAAGLVTLNAATLPPPSSTIALDNSLAAAGALSGPNYLIPASDGKQVGANLFESFSQFDLALNQSATFSGPGSVANVLVRVTGGTPAIIDGHLNCTIPGANLFLLDSAGIVFGPDAVLNVGSCLAASTANSIGLSDGGTFSATLAGSTMLTGGTPNTFSFMGLAAAINVLGYGPNPVNAFDSTAPLLSAPLQLSDGAVFSLIGGNISVQGRLIQAPAGGVNLVSTASTGQIMLDVTSPSAGIVLNQFTSFGAVALSNQATIDVSDDPGNPSLTGGRVAVRASTLSLNSSTINAQTTGGSSAGIDILLTNDLTLANSTFYAAGGGYIGISANNITLTNSTIGTQAPSGFALSAAEGSVTLLAAGQLSMTGSTIQAASGVLDVSVNSASLSGSTLSAVADTGERDAPVGPPGIILLTASGAVTLSSGSSVMTPGDFTANNSGMIQVSAGSFSLTGGSTIDASSQATGGSISIAANGPVVISGAGTSTSSVATISESAGPGVNQSFAGATGGSIQISGATIAVTDGAQLSTASQGGQSGTLISLTAGSITVDGAGTSIIADTADATVSFSNESQGITITSIIPGGTGGTIQLASTGALQITGGALVSSLTTGQGQAGNILLSGAQVTLSGSTVSTSSSSTGQAGSVSVTGGALTLSSGAVVSSAATGMGNGGAVTLNLSGPILFSGASSATAASSASAGGDVNVTSMTSLSLTGGSTIAADALQAGTITIAAPLVSLTGGSSISSNTINPSSSGQGADLTINTASLSLDASTISAQTTGAGPGGNLLIAPQMSGALLAVTLTDNSTITASTSAAGAAGNVTIAGNAMISISGGSTVSTNTSSTGVAGDVMLTATSVNIDGGSISSSSTGPGNAGSILIEGNAMISMSGGAMISTNTSSTGLAGDVMLGTSSSKIDFLTIDGGSISSSSTGSGSGGSVMITARKTITLDGSGSSLDATSASVHSTGGDISVTARRILVSGGSIATSTPGSGGVITLDAHAIDLFSRATLSATAGNDGNISLLAPGGTLFIQDSVVTAMASGTGGGKIFIDPTLVILEGSMLNGLSAGTPVQVVFDPSVVLLRSQSQILTDALILPPQTDVSGALLALPSALPQINLGLAPVCAPRLDADFSSFVITGEGGRPPQPGGWVPDLQLQGQ